MEFLVEQAPGRSSGHARWGVGHPAVPALVGMAAVGAVMAWELVRPTLPVPYELAIAARSPGAASWVGRLPMAGLAVLGTIALYMFLTRTVEKRAAVYGVAILTTTPAWFVHGRTMTGAMMPMVCSVTIFAALGIAILAPGATTRARGAGIGIAVAAAALSVVAARWGMPQRGLVSVAAVPAIAVGAAAMMWRATTRTSAEANAAAGTVLAAGVVIALVGAGAALRGDGWIADVMLGTRALAIGKTTFDVPVAAIAYGLLPWSPLVPFALARRPSSAGHLAIMIAAVLAIAVRA
jgi:4-amino-4-deoxy-L-arabinose transferase-like glycosyltransferase